MKNTIHFTDEKGESHSILEIIRQPLSVDDLWNIFAERQDVYFDNNGNTKLLTIKMDLIQAGQYGGLIKAIIEYVGIYTNAIWAPYRELKGKVDLCDEDVPEPLAPPKLRFFDIVSVLEGHPNDWMLEEGKGYLTPEYYATI